MTRRLLTVATAVGLVLAAAPGSAPAATHSVHITRDGFRAATRTIAVGDTVVWRNVDTRDHQVVADNGAFASPVLRRNETFSVTILTPGTYRYRDALNPRARGTIIVRGAPPSVALAVSAPIVIYGSQIRVTGQISLKRPGETVQVLSKPHPQGSFTEVARVVTGNDGVFDFTTTPQLLTEYQAVWAGASSPAVRVEVKPRISIRYNPRTGVFFTHVTSPRSYAGRFVYLQRRSQFGQWVNVKKFVLRSGSSRRFRIWLPRGRHEVRMFMTVNQAGAGYLASASGVWTLTRARGGS
jgi:plastocyanin